MAKGYFVVVSSFLRLQREFHRDQKSAPFHGLAVGSTGSDCLRPRVDRAVTGLSVFCPEGHKSPAHHSQLTPAGVGVEADHRLHGLRGYVLGRGKVDVKDICISGLHHLGDPLLVGPSAVSPAHAGNSTPVGCREQKANVDLKSEGRAASASGTPQRLAGQICYGCKAPLPAPHQPGEQLCARCEAAKRPVYMSFMQRKNWFCQFLEPSLQTALPVKLSFADVEKVRELAKRGGGLLDLESAAALEHGIEIGRGEVWLDLTPAQYAKLKTKG
jgi:hypothetical protein